MTAPTGFRCARPSSIKVPWMSPENTRRTKNFRRLPFVRDFPLARKVPYRADWDIVRGSGASRREKPLILQYVFAVPDRRRPSVADHRKKDHGSNLSCRID